MSGLCDPATCTCEPISWVRVVKQINYDGSCLPVGDVLPVHHMAPWGPSFYLVNDLGHRYTANRDHVQTIPNNSAPFTTNQGILPS